MAPEAAGRVRLAGRALALALAATSTAAAATPAETPACALRDAAPEAGLDFVHERGTTAERHLVETMGAGVAWLDFDGDGWLDLYAVQSGPFPPPGMTGGSPPEAAANRLFRNLGPGSGPDGAPAGSLRFEEVAAAAGVGHRGYGMGAAVGDVDGDGDPDLLVTNYGPDAFFRNRGDGTFEEATGEIGAGADGWSSSGAFADGDGDGDLDLYLSRYVDYPLGEVPICPDPETGSPRYCDPAIFLGAADRYYTNRGDGTYEETADEAGLGQGSMGERGRGLGVLFTDLDGDLRPDLYVANDVTINFLFRNSGTAETAGGLTVATFEDLSLLSGTAVNMDGKPEAGMGVAAADFDFDGDPDLAVTNFDVETNTLYRNLGGMQFSDDSAPSGFGVPSFNLLGFGLAAVDLDADGALDLYVANGHIFFVPRRADVAYAQRDLILLGDGKGGFTELRCPGLERDPRVGRGLAVADADRDGDPDLAIVNNGGSLQLLASGLPGYDGASVLGVRLRGAGMNTQGVGARLDLVTSKRLHRRWVQAGGSYQSAGDRAELFALPPGEEPKALEVRWPGGGALVIENPPTGAELQVYEE